MKNRYLTFLMVVSMIALLVGCSFGKKADLKLSIDEFCETTNMKDDEGKDILKVEVRRPNILKGENIAFVNEAFDQKEKEFNDVLNDEIFPIASDNAQYIDLDDIIFEVTRRFTEERNDSKILSLLYLTNRSIGAPHDTQIIDTLNLDLENKKIIKFDDLSVTTREDLEVKLTELINNQIKVKLSEEDLYYYDDYEENIKDAFIDNSFYFTETGLVFVYNTYSLAPHAAGSQEFEITYETLRGIIKDEYIK